MNQPIKILFTIPNFVTAGSGGAMLNIIQKLDKERFTPSICVLKLGGKLEGVVRDMGIPLIEAPFIVPAKPYISFYARAYTAAQMFKRNGYDLWHSFHYGDDYSEPIIARLSGAKSWVFTKKNMNWHQNAWIVRSLLASGIAIQNTDMLKDFFKSWPLHRKVFLIPRGVDTDKFRHRHKPKKDLQLALNIPEEAVLVGCVANLVPVKGHAYLIAAAAHCPSVHLLFAGQANNTTYLKQLKTQIKQLGLENRIHFMGSIADIPAFHALMDINVLPTRRRGEGCPVALLEAMACSVACIATNVSGSRDLIDDGVTGLLVPPEDPEALAQAIQHLVENRDLISRLGVAARRRVEQHYTIEQEVTAHEQFYSDILKISTAKTQKHKE